MARLPPQQRASKEPGLVAGRRKRAWPIALCLLTLFAGLLVATRHLSRVVPTDDAAVRVLPRGKLRTIVGFHGEDFAPFVPARISGTVRSLDGDKTVAAARVCATCASCGLVDLPPAACVMSDEHGAYALDPSDMRPVLVAAFADGFNPGVANEGRPVAMLGQPVQGLDIRLQSGGAVLSGTIVDALGGPVADARVQVMRADMTSRSTIDLQSDQEGRFKTWVAKGAVVVRAEAQGYAPAVAYPVAPSEDVELLLTPASQVRGRVLVEGSDEPVAKAEVRAFPRNGNARVAAAISDERGEFVLAALDPGTYALVAEHAAFRGAARQPVGVGLADVVENVVVRVSKAVSVLGHVQVEPNGVPCAGYVALGPASPVSAVLAKQVLAESELDANPNAVPSLSANIEVDGSVSFKGVVPGRYHVTLQCADRVLDRGPELLEVQDRDLQVVWKMKRGLGLTVHVVNARGLPVPDARLTLLIQRPGAAGPPLGMGFSVDAQGTATLPGSFYAGTYTLEASGGLRTKPVTVELRDGAGMTEITLRTEGSGSVVVDARAEDGRAVNGLRVTARAERPSSEGPSLEAVTARALGDGKYQLGPLTAGRYRVSAEDGTNPPIAAAGPDGDTLEVLDGATVLAQLRINRLGSVHGTVVDEGGQPEANVWVSATYQTESAGGRPLLGMEPSRAMTDAEGRFELSKLTPGVRYQLRANEPQGAAATLRDVSVGQEVKLVLPAASVISGLVVDARGRPQPNSSVHAHHAATGVQRSARAGLDGSFRIAGVPAGKIELMASRPPSEFAQQELELRGGETRAGVRLSLMEQKQDAPSPGTL